MTDKQKRSVDPAALLQVVSEATASLSAALTPEERAGMRERAAVDGEASMMYSVDQRVQAMDEFELLAASDALETLAADVRAFVERRYEEVLRKALDVYYVAEELARDPAHADLVPRVAAMRRAFENQYGRPIPPKPQP